MAIKQDKSRFTNIVKGRVKKEFDKYITKGEIIGKKEDEFVKIPIHRIDIPNFRFGSKNDEQGVGNGQGEGDQSQQGQGDGNQPGQGQKPGNNPAEHMFETELSIDDLAQILGEKLELPRIEPKGDKNLKTTHYKYNGIAPIGPKGLKHFKTTYKRALKRAISSGSYKEGQTLVPIRDDFKYKAPKPVKTPQSQAVVFYIMDVSGSMGEEQKKIVQIESFWINVWLKKHYKGLENRFIVHDASSREVSENEFFTISATGGTLISSAYETTLKIIENEYPPQDWNIYIFQFSDGDNWSGEDSKKCMEIIENKFLPIVNSFNYGEVYSQYGSGNFSKSINDYFGYDHEKIEVSFIKGREGILDSIRHFLRKGK